MTKTEVSVVVFIIFGIWMYFGNIYKLTQCDFDFKQDMRCEVIHGVGLIGPVSFATYWAGTDK